MIGNLKKKLIKNMSNLPGWRTKRKILVIESDDWGTIRMPSRKTYDSLKKAGIELDYGDAHRYNLYDCLASKNDLASLFELLDSVKDKNGNPAVFTSVAISCNPDFEKIKAHDFEKYFAEPFNVTLAKYNQSDAFPLWKEGIEKHLFIPQFHGREHLNVPHWMRALQNNDKHTRIAFEHSMWGIKNSFNPIIHFEAAFDVDLPEDIKEQEHIIEDGLNQFEQLHGYRASFFVPPNGPFNTALEKVSATNDIKYMSGSKIQKEPLGHGKFKKRLHYLGQTNKHKQSYITRNCFFEPNKEGTDWIDTCLNEIENAFYWHKPAVISSHRLNYIGVHDEKNRDKGLRQLKILFQKMLAKWPEIEFMTSNELGDIIVQSK